MQGFTICRLTRINDECSRGTTRELSLHFLHGVVFIIRMFFSPLATLRRQWHGFTLTKYQARTHNSSNFYMHFGPKM